MAAFDTPNTLPENNSSLGNIIDTNLISTSTPEGYVQNNDYEKNLINQYNQQFAPQEIGPQGNALYPGLGHNINATGVSDPMFGSQGVYTYGGNIMAIDPILARRKAISDAAQKRATELSKPFEFPKLAQFTDQKFQQKLNNDFNGFIANSMAEAKAKGGDAWKKLLEDPTPGTVGGRFHQGMENYETVVKNLNQVTDMVATIDKGLADNSIYLSSEKKKVYDEYKKMLGSFSDYDTFSKQDIGELHTMLQGERDLNDYFNKSGVLSTLKAKVEESYYVNDKGEYYKTGTTKKTSYSEIIDEFSIELMKTTLANSSFTLEDVRANLNARLKPQIEVTGGITKKNESSIAREQAEEINAWDSKNQYTKGKEKVLKGTTYDSQGKRTGNFDVKAWADYNINLTSDKTIDVNERTPDNKIQTKKIKGIPLDGVEILNSDGSATVVPGLTYARIGTNRTIIDPKDPNKYIIVAEADVEVPTRTESFTDGEEDVPAFDTYSTQKAYVIISKNGVGTGTGSKIENSIKNEKKRKLYIEGKNQLNNVGKERTKPSGGNNVDEYGVPIK